MADVVRADTRSKAACANHIVDRLDLVTDTDMRGGAASNMDTIGHAPGAVVVLTATLGRAVLANRIVGRTKVVATIR